MAEIDSLELKKRSRRRLVGAAALALVAAIILPMVMDGEPGVTVQDIQVTIPDRDADSRLAQPISGRLPVIVDDEVVSEVLAPDAAPLEPDVGDVPAPVISPPAPPPAPAAVKPPDVPVRTLTPAPPAPASEDAEAARVRAILEGNAPAADEAGQSFVVQAAAFSDENKARSLSDDLKSRGFNAFTEQAGAVTRVRVGPFASRDAADKAAQRLMAIGIDGVVTVR